MATDNRACIWCGKRSLTQEQTYDDRKFYLTCESCFAVSAQSDTAELADAAYDKMATELCLARLPDSDQYTEADPELDESCNLATGLITLQANGSLLKGQLEITKFMMHVTVPGNSTIGSAIFNNFGTPTQEPFKTAQSLVRTPPEMPSLD